MQDQHCQASLRFAAFCRAGILLVVKPQQARLLAMQMWGQAPGMCDQSGSDCPQMYWARRKCQLFRGAPGMPITANQPISAGKICPYGEKVALKPRLCSKKAVDASQSTGRFNLRYNTNEKSISGLSCIAAMWKQTGH